MEPNQLPTPQPVYYSEQFSVYRDHVQEGSFRADAVSPTEIVSNYPVQAGAQNECRTWHLTEDLRRFPQLQSNFPLVDAAYNMALQELKLDTTPLGIFDAGAQWKGAWTRDASYSVVLSLAAIDPGYAKATLLCKVKRNRIVQDTGTGGSWPVSTDRVCWALAAWELYLVTGDRDWLEQSSTIIENTLRDDEQVVFDPSTGLARGESSFLDWREQTYPRWMQPVDIFGSISLGTNAVYHRAFCVMGHMSRELGRPSEEWDAKADRIRSAMNVLLWMDNEGLYGQYRYGLVFQTLSPRLDALGHALCMLFEVADPTQRDVIFRSQPFMPFGVPSVYPEAADVQPYHNRSVWPFVQAFWNLAAAKQRNEKVLLHGLACLYRSSALFLTNKENFVSDTGSPVGTAVNSDRQLWSVAGSLAMVYRILLGMDFRADGLHLNPCIPERFQGTYRLSDFRYRDALLSITVKGFGFGVHQILLDGEALGRCIPASLTGTHLVVVEMDNCSQSENPFSLVNSRTAPDTPSPVMEGGRIVWPAVAGAIRYQVYCNAELLSERADTWMVVHNNDHYKEFQVVAVDASGLCSFLSAAIVCSPDTMQLPAALSESGDHRAVTLEHEGTTGLRIPVELQQGGSFSIAFRYANGSGSVTSSNMCAIRTMFLDDKRIGAIVMPQRGLDKWDDFGVSSQLRVELTAGRHLVELRLLPSDHNMGEINRAVISDMIVTRIQSTARGLLKTLSHCDPPP